MGREMSKHLLFGIIQKKPFKKEEKAGGKS